jgi:hypothetical protein
MSKRNPGAARQPKGDYEGHRQAVRHVDYRQAQRPGSPKKVTQRLTGKDGGDVPASEFVD